MRVLDSRTRIIAQVRLLMRAECDLDVIAVGIADVDLAVLEAGDDGSAARGPAALRRSAAGSQRTRLWGWRPP
jgi:hypothetical protein